MQDKFTLKRQIGRHSRDDKEVHLYLIVNEDRSRALIVKRWAVLGALGLFAVRRILDRETALRQFSADIGDISQRDIQFTTERVLTNIVRAEVEAAVGAQIIASNAPHFAWLFGSAIDKKDSDSTAVFIVQDEISAEKATITDLIKENPTWGSW